MESPDAQPAAARNRAEAVRAFLSITQLKRIARFGEGAERSIVEEGWGAVLTIDVSGFAAIAERHAREGSRGIEALSEIVHELFGAITAEVLRAGGDVIYHAGDAVCALFPAASEAERDAACRRAASAALATLARIEASAKAAGVVLRIAIGCGETQVWEVGGRDGAWILFVQGEAVRDNAQVDRVAPRGVVVASASVWSRLGKLGSERRGEPVEGGAYRVIASAAAAMRALEVPDAPLPAVLASLPPVVRSRFESGAPPPVPEFRPVSTFFVSLRGLETREPSTLPRLQAAIASLQGELARLGSPQLDVLGDKGLGLVGVFGLPPQANEDDATRAVEAALAAHATFAAHDIDARIGVATGVVWAGPAGTSARTCYDVVGSVTILAARLMQASTEGVLVGSQTQRLAARSIEFVELPAMRLKGFAAPQPVFRPLGRRLAPAHGKTTLAGRRAEIARFEARLDALAAGSGGVVLVEAEPGMGKSVLRQTAHELASSRGIRVLDGGAEAIESATPYYAVRGAVLDLFGVPARTSAARARELVLAQLEADAPELVWLAPLLDAIVAIDLADTPESAQIVGTTRAERLGDLMVALVRAAAARGPLLWSIEDLHWADRASWSLCRRLVEEVPGLLFFGTTRAVPSPPPEREHLVTRDDAELIVLADLGATTLGEIAAMRLGVASLPDALVTLLAARADGNPFFAEEIALAAREAGGLVVTEGRVEIARPLETLDLPTSITALITSRMDRLANAEQRALRCASVLGASFDTRTLGALVPDVEAGELVSLVAQLAEATFLDPEPSAHARGGWRFRHAFLHETAYALVTFAERRALHATAARAIESDPDIEPASVTALLAHHWDIAGSAERAAHYHGLAGVQALEADANAECVEHLTKALRFDEEVRGALEADLRRARWSRMLTEASYSLGDHEAARRWGDRTFRWSGLRAPEHAGHVLGSVAAHVWRRYVPARQTDEDTRARYAEALFVSSTLQTVAMWEGDRVRQLGLAVYAEVVSRSCVPSPGRAIAQGSMGFLLVAVGMHETGVRDALAAAAMADELGDATARISTKVIVGLVFSSLGRNREALAPLAEARELAERVGSGLWRHRALFQSGEPAYHLGQLTEADELFERCVAVARKVEPPVAGMSRAMQAACRLRRGASPDDALALLAAADGLALAEPGPPMMALVGLGVHAWALVLGERYADALASARKCLAVVEGKGEDAIAFARAMDGIAHAALTLTRLAELRREAAPGTSALPPADGLLSDAERAAAGLGRLAGRWPAARPLSYLVGAYQLRLRGKQARAARALEKAADAARAMDQPWELALALHALARRHGRPPSPELAELVRAHGLGGVEAGYFPL